MASERGRGAQVRLDDDARQYARGGTALKLIDNVRLKQAAEEAGTAPDGDTPDGSLADGTAADDEVLAPGGEGSSAVYTASVTGAVSRTLVSKAVEALSVFDFGAVGDGTTDDLLAFRAAAASGRTILVPTPASFYKVTGTISPAAGTKFVGNAGRPEIRMTSGSTCRIFDVNSVNGCGISWLTLNGNVPTVTDSGPVGRLTVTVGSFIEDCAILNAGGLANGAVVVSGGSTLCRVNRNLFTTSTGQGVYVQSSPQNEVCNNTFSGIASLAIRLVTGANYNLIEGNSCISNGAELIGVSISADFNRVIGNRAVGCHDNGISIVGAYNTVTGNTCVLNTAAGIGVWGAFNAITGNTVISNNQDHSVMDWGGVHVLPGYGGTGQYNQIAGNICDDNQATPTQNWGIRIESLGGGTFGNLAWTAGEVISSTLRFRRNGLNIYQAATTGTTGASAPVHTSGTVSDGGVSWTWLNAYVSSVGTRGCVAMANSTGRNRSGTPNSDAGNWNANSLFGFNAVRMRAPDSTNIMQVVDLATSAAGLPSGAFWNNGNVVNVVP